MHDHPGTKLSHPHLSSMQRRDMLNVVELTSRTQRKEKAQGQTPHSGKIIKSTDTICLEKGRPREVFSAFCKFLKSSQEDKLLVLLTRLEQN